MKRQEKCPVELAAHWGKCLKALLIFANPADLNPLSHRELSQLFQKELRMLGLMPEQYQVALEGFVDGFFSQGIPKTRSITQEEADSVFNDAWKWLEAH